MPSPSATKASEKQQACKKLLALLYKDYGKHVPQFSMPVLETMLFAACLEDNSWDATEQGYERLNKLYYDLNEIRVSSVAEIEETLSGMQRGDWAGLRIRSILRFVFETTYTYDYEKLKRLTQDSGQKRLKKIDNMSPFVRNFTVQHSLGGYLVCLDASSTRAAIHLGLVPPGMNEEQAGEFLRPGLKKADTFGFTCALRCLATDPRFIERLSEPPDEDEEFDVGLVETRFSDLKKPKKKKKKPPAPVKKAAAPTKKKKTTVSKAAVASKSTSKKTAAAAKTKASSATRTTSKAASKKKTAKVASAKSTTAGNKKANKKPTAKTTPKKTVAAKKKTVKKASSTTKKKAPAKKTKAKKK